MNRYGGISGFDEDAYSEGVLIVLESLKEFDKDKGVHYLGFIKVKLKHYFLNRSRKNKNIYSLDAPVDKDEELTYLDTIVDKFVDIPGDCINKEEVIHIKEAINALTKTQREIIEDYYFNDMTLNDIAIKRDIHLVSVAKIKASALKNLRKKLKYIC